MEVLGPLLAGKEAAGGAVLLVIIGTTTGEFHSARWTCEEVYEEEVLERQAEVRCPRCGRNLDPDEAPVIRVGVASTIDPMGLGGRLKRPERAKNLLVLEVVRARTRARKNRLFLWTTQRSGAKHGYGQEDAQDGRNPQSL